MAARLHYAWRPVPTHVILTGIFSPGAGRREADMLLGCDLDRDEFNRDRWRAERHFEDSDLAEAALIAYDAIAEDADGSVTCPQHKRRWSYGLPGFTCRRCDSFEEPRSWPCDRPAGIAEDHAIDLDPVRSTYTMLHSVAL